MFWTVGTCLCKGQRDQYQPCGHLHNLINTSSRYSSRCATSPAGISATFGAWSRHSQIGHVSLSRSSGSVCVTIGAVSNGKDTFKDPRPTHLTHNGELHNGVQSNWSQDGPFENICEVLLESCNEEQKNNQSFIVTRPCVSAAHLQSKRHRPLNILCRVQRQNNEDEASDSLS